MAERAVLDGLDRWWLCLQHQYGWGPDPRSKAILTSAYVGSCSEVYSHSETRYPTRTLRFVGLDWDTVA